jgi:hypothetical protein
VEGESRWDENTASNCVILAFQEAEASTRLYEIAEARARFVSEDTYPSKGCLNQGKIVLLHHRLDDLQSVEHAILEVTLAIHLLSQY